MADRLRRFFEAPARIFSAFSPTSSKDAATSSRTPAAPTPEPDHSVPPGAIPAQQLLGCRGHCPQVFPGDSGGQPLNATPSSCLRLLLLPLGRGVTRVRRVRQMVDCPPQTVPNLRHSPPCDHTSSYLVRRRRIDLLRLMVTLLAPLGALERPAQEPQSGALVHVQIVSSIAVEHFPIANTLLEMPSASLVSRGREGAGSLVEGGGEDINKACSSCRRQAR